MLALERPATLRFVEHPDVANIFSLAAELHVDVDVILDWPYEKYTLWCEFFQWRAAEQAKEQALAEAKGRRG